MITLKTMLFTIIVALAIVLGLTWLLSAIVFHIMNNRYWREQRRSGKYALILK